MMYDAIRDLIDEITDIPNPTADQLDFLALIGQLLTGWEDAHEEPVTVTPLEALKSLIEDNGLRQRDLVGPVFSTESVASEVISDRRPLRYEMVQKLSEYFHVSPSLFY